MGRFDDVLLFGALATAAWMAMGQDLEIPTRDGPADPNSERPFFMGGRPEQLFPRYNDRAQEAPHTASGDGLSSASTGEPTSFSIKLAADDGGALDLPGPWNIENGRFIYVWISGEDQVVNAEVVNNRDGTLTATYTVDFPGDYLISVEDIETHGDAPGHSRPFVGSPFKLTVQGSPKVNPDSLPLCGQENDGSRPPGFWRKGSWISANVASSEHGVLRNGWVYQPESCVYDTFSRDDLVGLAALDEPTWLLILGGSVQRGVFLSLVDMVLAQGQKDELVNSEIQKCWGWSDVHYGNLRITYQDMRFWKFSSIENLIVCNDEKLASGGTASYVHAAEALLRDYIFAQGNHWPDAILTAGFVNHGRGNPNFSVKIPMSLLPSEWGGKLIFMEQMTSLGYYWKMMNPTIHDFSEVRPARGPPDVASYMDPEVVLSFMEECEDQDSRVTFLSAMPFMQPILWQNEALKRGTGMCYACSQHYHFVCPADDPNSFNGSYVVRSMVTEMIANVMIGHAAGSKEELHDKMAMAPDMETRIAGVKQSPFQVCSDCPASLVPFHVKYPPQPSCASVTALREDAAEHDAWNHELCPDWCMKTAPVSQTPTQSGPVDVRECKPDP